MQHENDQGGQPTDFDKAKSDVSDRLRQENERASELLHDARDEVTRKAGDYASEATQVISDKAEEAQRDIGSSLAALGGALRAASDHLASNDERNASKFALDAASGLERLSSSLKQKPFSQVLDDVQSFGRQNPGVLLAGSVLAGLALGRFIKASPSARPDSEAAPGGLRSHTDQPQGWSADRPQDFGVVGDDGATQIAEQDR
ncbi:MULTISPECIES: hypothetical protein [unclassified Mesorhizobium]|uniref:hypothetical protein n=1 Tax=unclassified Mesorhizobium TaxID=325217 RepID=UPI0003D06DB9|nr:MULTISPECIES: hypothetical protein [unclassified Mesorhizobium]ESZ40973.1 hypothetical protein X731_25125 [Mesorhizobium sp. L2C054A000]ESZ73057.1 hypothetical protein X726_25890 [Mesorhizobium sp. L103C105A0]